MTFFQPGASPDGPRQACPFCGCDQPASPRYPAYVCAACCEKATDAQGRRLEFFNESVFGGLAARYRDTGEPYQGGGRCFIDGIECQAVEARFGGIVIQPRARTG